MDIKDTNYLKMQFWLKIYEKYGTEFQSFFEAVMREAFPDFEKIRPYGNLGDQGNDGYRPKVGIYYQVYAPLDPNEKDADAALKLKKDFNKLQESWDQISKIKEFYFVFNDKGHGSSIVIENALAELSAANKDIKFDKMIAKDLEEIFLSLKNDQIVSLGFNIDSTKALHVVEASLSKLEKELDRYNAAFVLKFLENIKDTVSNLNDESLTLDYEIKECHALLILERVEEAIHKYESIRKRYPTDLRAILSLAEIYLRGNDFKKNEDLLQQAERIDNEYWLLKLQKKFREYRLGTPIEVAGDIEDAFPSDPRDKASCYRTYSMFLMQTSEFTRAESFIERAIKLNPDNLLHYDARLLFMEMKLFEDGLARETMQTRALDFISAIDDVQQKIDNWGGATPRIRATFQLRRLMGYIVLENRADVESVAQEIFDLALQCHFDIWIESILEKLLSYGHLIPEDFNRLLLYLQKTNYIISDNLARIVLIQFNLHKTLIANGKPFFRSINKLDIVDFITAIENKEYDKVWLFLKDDPRFAVSMANTAREFPDLRKIIIENLPDDENIQKEKLLLLFNYDEKNINEAFDLLKGFDLSKLGYFECMPFLQIAKEKGAWDFVIILADKLLQHEKSQEAIYRLKFELFAANINLKRFLEAIPLGETLLSDPNMEKVFGDEMREILLENTLKARLMRGDNSEAKQLLEKHKAYSKSFEFKVNVEPVVYLRNNDPNTALTSIVAGIKVIKNPTPEQYGGLAMIFLEIHNLLNLSFISQNIVSNGCFVKFKDQERWYHIGDNDELDTTKIATTDNKHSAFIGKGIGDNVSYDNKYRSTTTEHTIEFIFSIEQYIHWQSVHHSQQLTIEGRWDRMEMVEVPTVGDSIDTQYIIAKLEDERKKRGDIFDLYCTGNVPWLCWAINEGNLINAIGRITAEIRVS